MELQLIIYLLIGVLFFIFAVVRMNDAVKKGWIVHTWSCRSALSLMPQSMRNNILHSFDIDEKDFKPVKLWQHIAIIFIGFILIILFCLALIVYLVFSEFQSL